jgi:hypothetical protein
MAGLALELLDSVIVKKNMPGSTQAVQTLLVQGLSHDFSDRRMVTTVYTGESLVNGFLLNSATQGILGTNVLSY